MSTMTAFGRVPTWGFGDRIRKIRRELGMSQAAFASALDVGEKAVASWESGRTTPDDLVALANKIQGQWDYSAAWLAGVNVPPQHPDGGPGKIAGIVADLVPHAFRRHARHASLTLASAA